VRLGVLDIGSNTVHLLIVDAHKGGAPVPAISHKVELRLAERMTAAGDLRDDVVAELLAFVQDAVRLAEDMGVTEVMAFATSAIRSAGNGPPVLAQVAARAGVEVRLLTGEQEARLTFLAVRRWFGWSAGRLLVLDIGGGSLELAVGDDEDPEAAFSLDLGAGRLTRTHLRAAPPDPDDLRALRRAARAEIAHVAGPLRRYRGSSRAVATSKTFRQLARIAGAAPSSEGPFVRRELAREDLREWVPKLAAMPVAELAALPGVSEGRAGQLLAGAVVAEAAMDLLDLAVVDLCPWALREGVILDRLDLLP
jgi:exopolyphosphatase/guanosine-5'-triphosphate,3'-diphosphate pyrophosphatase